MTALPQQPYVQPLGRPLTVAQYAALDQDDRHRWELQEGVMLVSPRPTPGT